MTTTLNSYKKTNVQPHISKDAIEKLLLKVGARGFAWRTLINGSEVLDAMLQWKEKSVGFRLGITYKNDEQRKQRLRAMYWYLKAKIEAIQFGLVDLEQEFLPYLLTGKGTTVYEEMESSGAMNNLLPPGESK